MEFTDAYRQFIQKHIKARTGERRSRLERGHRHAESYFLKHVWWPLRGNFDDLHPEYEVLDWRGRSYFADFAWLPGHPKLIFEIKGFGSHVRDMDRQKYCNELNRETFLHAMGYQVISFAYDDVERRPELCITLLRMMLGRYQPSAVPISRAELAEKEIIRLAIHAAKPIRPIDVVRHFGIDSKTAVNMLKRLCGKGWLAPTLRGRGERIVSYELADGVLDYF
ncbi:very-short-patch-repair endonuclease [Paenibacillus forsythiae]|uniref:Very-short-patch-repair endonuclease n=1 Tax=Paenibacillus forsythiae TaxID=365616 RepID=A0ABU3HBQ2_9BACL|nr:DUF559 domain-containing protein [Paenibacillus forsythiae]MDT3427891.1 very-short-patch-repair endonuclease [Paenibacillus forsythiae]